MTKKRLCGLTASDISGLIEPGGFDHSAAIKIANSIYKKRINRLSGLTGISKKLISFLETNSETGIYPPVTSEVSGDGTIKYLYISPEGLKIESVWLPDSKRRTVCVSTQSGCRMGCPFCVTGRYGFHGNLSAGDIVNQVISLPGSQVPTHVVFMGMGEPMDNLENVIRACTILTAEWGVSLSPGNITVSSVGITPAIAAFLERSRCNLAISLFSPFSDERLNVVPAEKIYPVHEIIGMLKAFPAERKRRFTVAYIMIRNVNDTDRHLEGLKDLLAGSGIRVNLIPYHQVQEDVNVSSSEERMMYFRHEMVMHGISASVRKSRGADISAACGLLASGLGK